MLDLITLFATRVPRAGAPFFPDMLWRLPPVPSDEQVAYLTFDDGPTRTMTPPLIDLLARHDAKATFFMIGNQVERLPHLARSVHQAGHHVGNHTYSHPDAWRTPTPDVLRELEQATSAIEEVLAVPVLWMRPPYGRFTQAMRDWCRLRRQRMTMWDVMPGDWLAGTTHTHVADRILSLIRPGSIIVLHDNPKAHDVTLTALEVVLPRLIDEGWSFLPLPDPAAVQRHAA